MSVIMCSRYRDIMLALCLCLLVNSIHAAILGVEDLGVRRFHFLGSASHPDDVYWPGELQVSMKVGTPSVTSLYPHLQDEPPCTLVRGFYTFRSVNADDIDSHWNFQHGLINWKAPLWITQIPRDHTLANQTFEPVRLMPWGQHTPVDFGFQIPRPAAENPLDSSYLLGVGKWTTTYTLPLDDAGYLKPVGASATAPIEVHQLVEDMHDPPEGFQPHMVAVLTPLAMRPLPLSQLLFQHVHHHLKLGIARHLTYVSQPQLDLLSRQPWIRDLPFEQFLMVEWSHKLGYAPFPYGHAAHYSEALAQNHALLSFWGTGAWLMIMDWTQVLQFSAPSSIGAIMKEDGCFMSYAKQEDVCEMRIQSDYVFCEECIEKSEPDIKSWIRKPWSEVLKLYRRHYLRSQRDVVNSLGVRGYQGVVDSSRIGGYFVMEGRQLHMPFGYGNCGSNYLPTECAYLMQVPNLFKVRRTDVKNAAIDIAFHWAADLFSGLQSPVATLEAAKYAASQDAESKARKSKRAYKWPDRS